MRLLESRSLFLIPLAATLFALVAACGGGGEEEAEVGSLTNPQDAPTAPPWDQPPEVLLLDPNAIPTLPAGGSAATPTPAVAAEGGEPGVCGPKYTVASGDTFSSIAEKCGSTTQGMRDANPGVDPLTIRPGQVINVPAPTPAPSP
jgi:LysM repeat protein